MATYYINSRQYERSAVAVIDGSLSQGTKMLLPPGAVVTGGGYTVAAAVGGTTPTLTLVDNASSPHTYLNAVSVASPASGALANNTVGRYYAAGAELTFSLGGTPAAGSGKVLVWVNYIVEQTSDELYGRSG